MTEFFKNNPTSLRHCLLYEFLRKKPVELAFSDFCKTVGNDAIKKEDFHICFNQFEQGRFDDDEKPIDNITDILRNDKQALRVCVLNEALPVFTRYENFCKVIGNDVMDYREFDFWFYRFFNQEFDLNFERDENKTSHELMDMPIDIMENVVEYLDIFDRMKLARTSRPFRTFVENQKLFHRTLKLNISNTRVTIWFNKSVNSEYVKTIDSCLKHHKNRRTFVRGVAYWKQALLDLNSVLKNPKLHLNTLEIVSDTDKENVFNDLEDASKFDHYLNVRNLILRVYSMDKLPNIIPSLKPGYLTSIYIDSHNPNVDLMGKVFEMEQWKQAKYFTMEGFFISPLHNFYHLKEFAVNLNELSLEDIREMKKVLFKSSEFEKCSLRVVPDDTWRSICEQEFGNALRENPHVYHYPIPNSTEHFEIQVGGWTLEIQRQKSSLSRTSRSFHAFVEDQKVFHNTLKFEVSYPTATISFNESANIQYIKEYAACRKVSKNREEIFRGVAYWKQAIRDFKKTLQNPKLHLDTLEIEVSAAIEISFNKGNVFNNLEEAFKLTHHLNVKNLILNEYSSSLLTSILPTLNPGYLTSIDIDFRYANVNSVGNVLETKQWKQVKYFEMNGAYFIWPLHHLYHLKEFTVYLERLSVENVRQIKRVLFKSPDFKKCSLTVSREIDASIIAQEFGNALRKSQYVYHYPIPTSTEYFEIRVEGHRFKVARKKN